MKIINFAELNKVVGGTTAEIPSICKLLLDDLVRATSNLPDYSLLTWSRVAGPHFRRIEQFGCDIYLNKNS